MISKYKVPLKYLILGLFVFFVGMVGIEGWVGSGMLYERIGMFQTSIDSE